MKGVGATCSPCSVGVGKTIICPSMGLSLWFPICSYLKEISFSEQQQQKD
jgi:hypothetical protein